MAKLNIESIGADWCIDDIIKMVLDRSGSFDIRMITIPENKLPHLKGTLTINNTTVNLSEAYSLDKITKQSFNLDTHYKCDFSSSELPQILIALNSNFIPVYALINNNPNPVQPVA